MEMAAKEILFGWLAGNWQGGAKPGQCQASCWANKVKPLPGTRSFSYYMSPGRPPNLISFSTYSTTNESQCFAVHFLLLAFIIDRNTFVTRCPIHHTFAQTPNDHRFRPINLIPTLHSTSPEKFYTYNSRCSTRS